MKKLCFITTVADTLQSFVVSQVVYFKQQHPDWEISLICDNNPAFAATLPKDIRYIPVSMGRGVSLSGISAVFSLGKIFKTEQFDMIVYATPNAALYSSVAGAFCAVKRRIYCQWGIRYVGFSGTSRRVFKILEKLTCRLSTNINAVSALNRAFAIAEGLYKADKAQVVGNGGTIGVDLTQYDISRYAEFRQNKRAELGVDNAFVLGFVGRLSRDKGTEELLRATKRLSQKMRVRLVCVGTDELRRQDIPDDIRQWAQDSGVLILTGEKSPEEVKEYYAAMDVYVHPTYREGFGMVLQEAGAMACPVITTRIAGASEVLQEGVSCLLCEPRDVDSLYQAIRSLCDDRERCAQMGRAARAYVEERYERGLMLANQLKRYEELLGEEVPVCN